MLLWTTIKVKFGLGHSGSLLKKKKKKERKREREIKFVIYGIHNLKTSVSHRKHSVIWHWGLREINPIGPQKVQLCYIGNNQVYFYSLK